MLAMSVLIGGVLIRELITGRTYSVGIILGDNSMVDQTSSPQAFWTTIGLLIIDVLVCPIVGIALLREAVMEHRRKISAKKQTPDDHEA